MLIILKDYTKSYLLYVITNTSAERMAFCWNVLKKVHISGIQKQCLKMIRNKCMDIFIYGMPFITLIWPSQYIYSLVIANIVDKAIQVHVCRLDRYNCQKMVLFSSFLLICLYNYFLHIGNKMKFYKILPLNFFPYFL